VKTEVPETDEKPSVAVYVNLCFHGSAAHQHNIGYAVPYY